MSLRSIISLAAFGLLLASADAATRPSLTRGPARKQKRATPLPDYAITYAPYAYLYSGENYWPSDIATHVANTEPEASFTPVATSVTLENLDTFASDVYLTSIDDPSTNPSWILGVKPDSTGSTSAPAIIIAADKGDFVDVFYFYFYSYNFGPTFIGINFDEHVGDWEHSMVRFVNGIPQTIYLSAHNGGAAYEYSAMTQTDNRATIYIATGSHANYATAGSQPLSSTLGISKDTTDAGVYWDVTANYRGFWFDNSTQTFSLATGAGVGATLEETEGADWLAWLGAWGDEQYPTSHSGQYCIFSECHYTSGPTGPFDKNLGRTTVCESTGTCTIATSI